MYVCVTDNQSHKYTFARVPGLILWTGFCRPKPPPPCCECNGGHEWQRGNGYIFVVSAIVDMDGLYGSDAWK